MHIDRRAVVAGLVTTLVAATAAGSALAQESYEEHFAERFDCRVLDLRRLTFLRFVRCEFRSCSFLADEKSRYIEISDCWFEDCEGLDCFGVIKPSVIRNNWSGFSLAGREPGRCPASTS